MYYMHKIYFDSTQIHNMYAVQYRHHIVLNNIKNEHFVHVFAFVLVTILTTSEFLKCHILCKFFVSRFNNYRAIFSKIHIISSYMKQIFTRVSPSLTDQRLLKGKFNQTNVVIHSASCRLCIFCETEAEQSYSPFAFIAQRRAAWTFCYKYIVCVIE